MLKIRIENPCKNNDREYFDFVAIDNDIVLTGYSFMSYIQGEWLVIKNYDIKSKKRSNISEEEVPLTDKVRMQTLDHYIMSIKCRKANEK